ncbi:AI-2E family transporter [Tessaracoccus sp.]|uniref:AI-2E family transporter n=1 Tax=Tessaracoccus sp. TaxID=1971211 RepID=UPI00261E8CE7|nr:AI-2E family transporter [Tessaracoccus sp.]
MADGRGVRSLPYRRGDPRRSTDEGINVDDVRLRRLGRSSWALLGIIALVVVIAMAIGAIRGIVVPLVIAVILGTVLEPLVEWLERRGLPATLATVVSLLTAVLVGIGMVAIVIWGFLKQLPEISAQLVLGWESFVQWGKSLDIDEIWLERGRVAVQDYAPRVSQGILGAVSGTFSGAVSFGIGAFFAIFFLFFVLRDARTFPEWLAKVTHLDARAVAEVTIAAKESIRGYFKGIGITALITAPIFMIPLLLLRVPLAVPIFILYFFLSFIPFIGAWLTGAFAVLIAFSTGGASAAGIVALSLLVSNGTIQSAVSSWALGSSLKLHPVAVLLATLVGGTIAGILGMILGAPLVAAAKRSVEALREIKQEREIRQE